MSNRATICLTALLLASCAGTDAVQQSRDYLHHGNVLLAYRTIDTARAKEEETAGAVAAETEACYQEMRLRFLVYSARQAIYEDEEDEAIRLLTEVQQAQPGYPDTKALVERARRKKALRLAQRGQTMLSSGELVAALENFELALREDPECEQAKEGRIAVEAANQRLTGEAQKQFLEAIRKLPELRYSEAIWHATVAVQRDSTRTDAEEVRIKASRALAEGAQQRAEASRKKGAYGAAMMSYREAQRLDPQLPGVAENIAAMENEVKAQALQEKASMAIRVGKLDEAREMLQQAFELTALERASINELLFETRKRASMIVYDRGRDMEIVGKKSEALAEFEAVAKDWPDGLKDEKTRIGSLRADIQGAAQAFAAGQAAEQKNELKQALEHYRAAQTYYPLYQDVAARIARLKAATAGPGN